MKQSVETEQLRGAAGVLSIVTVQNAQTAPRGDILFVHGAWSSSWYWENFFMPWFADRGYRCRAVSLRGHGGSDGRVRWASISNYVADVAVAAEGLDNPIIVGHSMGGYIAQKYASKYPVRAVALLASVPPSGAWHALHRIVTERPRAFIRTIATLDLYGVVADPETARALLFSRDESRTDRDHLLKHLKSESFRGFIDMLINPVCKHIPKGVPVAVIGAEFDQIISDANLRETARFHGVEPITLPMASHMLTVDDRWRDAATILENWLSSAVLQEDRPNAVAANHPATANPLSSTKAYKNTSDKRYPPHIAKRAKMLGRMQYLPLTLSSILDHVEEVHPEALVWSREAPPELGEIGQIHCQTWVHTAQRARKLAAALQGMGISEGDRVASIAWNTHRHLELYYGVAGLGAVLHTVNPRLSLEHLSYMINEADDQVLFYDGTFSGLVAALKALCPGVRHWVQLSNAPKSPAWTDTDYDCLISEADPIVDWPVLDEHGAAVLCYTSGTTGKPKGVLYSHRALVLEAMTAIGPDALAISRQDTVAPIVPMFHVNAWSLPFAAAIAGAGLALPGANLGGEDLHDFFEKTSTTISAGVPTIWQGLLSYLDKTGQKFSTMDRTIVGGSAVSEPMIRDFRDRYGVEVIHGWGMTETSPLGAINALTLKEVDSLSPEDVAQLLKRQGRAPFGVRLKIRDNEGEDLPRDGEAAGHLMIQGHWVIDSYFGKSISAIESGWFDTGDIATIGTNSIMTITDRDKDLIKSGGEWISSILLEEIALERDAIIEAAAIAIPHPKWGERPLIVCVTSGNKTPSVDDIKALYAGRLPDWQAPEVTFTDQLPIGATGKVLKADLRKTYANFFDV
jgi:acyl-CoA synthetase (AMP-forming)/AMP-acid ligase II/pimeloyl-ACP methyl ester carboxylesterase